ncbi:MAG: P-loop ATPase, Sll1717 family, partial [Stellaceae bacterium]
MERAELLKQLSFGTQVAEEETNALARYFVETHQWNRIARGEIDLIRGDKGAGKSAIYSLLIGRQSEFFDNRVLIIGAENPRGDTVFKDIVPDPPSSEIEFIFLWKLYILVLITKELREYGITDTSGIVFKSLENAGFLESEVSKSRLLKKVQDYARRLINLESIEGGVTLDPNTGLLNGLTGKIVTREPSPELRSKGIVAIDYYLFDKIEDVLESYQFHIWILLDRLDVAFTENHQLEANALRALIRVYG